jgi:hypothetical protein
MYVATAKNKTQGKLSEKRTFCVFVRYAVNHAVDVYRILNPNVMACEWVKVKGLNKTQWNVLCTPSCVRK